MRSKERQSECTFKGTFSQHETRELITALAPIGLPGTSSLPLVTLTAGPCHREPDLTVTIPRVTYCLSMIRTQETQYLQQQLDDFGVDESMDRLSVDVCDQIPSL